MSNFYQNDILPNYSGLTSYYPNNILGNFQEGQVASLKNNRSVHTLEGNTILSPSEIKLLSKTIAVAQILGAKLKLRKPTSSSNAAFRYKLLLMAFAKIVKAVGQTERAIGATNRFLDLLSILSYFSFPQADQLLTTPKWVLVVAKKLDEAKVRTAFSNWIKALRSLTMRKMISPELDLLSGISHNIHNSRATKYQDANMTMLANPSYPQRPTADFDFYSREATEAFILAKRTLQTWRLAVRGKLVERQRALNLSRKCLLLWEKFTLLSRVYQYHYKGALVTKNSLFESQGQVASRYMLIRDAFREWRAALRMRVRGIDVVGSLAHRAFSNWKRRAAEMVGLYKAAMSLRRIRSAYPFLLNWISSGVKQQFAASRAADHNRVRLIEGCLDVWMGKLKGRRRIRRFVDSWRSITDFRSRNLIQANYFYNKKLAAVVIHRLRRLRTRNLVVTRAAANFALRNELRCAGNLFGVWRRLLQWVRRNSEKVRTIRAAKDAKTCLDMWRGWRRSRQTADSIFKAATFKRVLGAWQTKLNLIHEGKVLLTSAFEQWRKLLVTRRTVQIYLQLSSGPSRQVTFDKKRHTWIESLKKFSNQDAFTYWRHLAILKRRSDVFLVQRDRGIRASFLKGWRLHTNVKFYLAQKPWRTKRRTLRKMKQASRSITSREYAQDAKLIEYLQGKEYIIHFRAFERWQQAFQARKMEEHLCQQNLTYYQHRKRFAVMRLWRLTAIRRVFSRLQETKMQKKVFSKWNHLSTNVEEARKRRILSRHLSHWRQSYRSSVVRGLLSQSNRRALRLALIFWRERCRHQREGHHRSAEFIGASSKRYFWQRWRTESHMHRLARNRKPQLLPPSMTNNAQPPKPLLIKSIGEDQPRYLQQLNPPQSINNSGRTEKKQVRFQDPHPHDHHHGGA